MDEKQEGYVRIETGRVVFWMPKSEYDLREKLWEEEREKRERFILWGPPELTPEQEKENRVKLAWVNVHGLRYMIGVDNETMEGYELDEHRPVVKIPLVPTEYDSFERWCTLMDV